MKIIIVKAVGLLSAWNCDENSASEDLSFLLFNRLQSVRILVKYLVPHKFLLQIVTLLFSSCFLVEIPTPHYVTSEKCINVTVVCSFRFLLEYSVRLLVHELQYWLHINDCNWAIPASGTVRFFVVYRCSLHVSFCLVFVLCCIRFMLSSVNNKAFLID